MCLVTDRETEKKKEAVTCSGVILYVAMFYRAVFPTGLSSGSRTFC